MTDLDLVTADGQVRVFTLLHQARLVLLNLGEPGGVDIKPWNERVSPPSAQLAACSSRSYDREEGRMRSYDVDRVGRAAGRFMHLHFAEHGLDHQPTGHRSSKTVRIPAPPWRSKAGWQYGVFSGCITGANGLAMRPVRSSTARGAPSLPARGQ